MPLGVSLHMDEETAVRAHLSSTGSVWVTLTEGVNDLTVFIEDPAQATRIAAAFTDAATQLALRDRSKRLTKFRDEEPGGEGQTQG